MQEEMRKSLRQRYKISIKHSERYQRDIQTIYLKTKWQCEKKNEKWPKDKQQ